MAVPCPSCSRVFANKRNLASHKTRFHCSDEMKMGKDQLDSQSDQDLLDNQSDETDEGYQTDENRLHVDKLEDEISQANSDEETSIISRKRKGNSSHQQKVKKSRKGHESTSKINHFVNLNEQSNEPKTVNIKNAADHTKLIKMLCKAVLDGTIRLPPHHIASLKPHAKFIRKIAHGKIKYGKMFIRKEVRRTKHKGGSILKTVLETVLPILTTLFL